MFTRCVMAGLVLVLVRAAAAAGGDGPRWFKGNTHTHTLWSDGDGAPELVAEWYRSNGYHFIVLSDHNVLSRGETWFPVTDDGRLTPGRVDDLEQRFGPDWVQLRRGERGMEMRLKTLDELRARFEAHGEFLFIEGEEITDSFERVPVHVNGLNLAELVPPQGGASIAETLQRNIDAVIEQGRRLGRPTLAHVNHPNFAWALRPEHLAAVEGDPFFEVYNGHAAVHNNGGDGHPSMDAMWDIALTARLGELDLGPMFGLATDDAHHYHRQRIGLANAGRGWVMVRAERLDAASIIGAMERGDFYSSSGVTLEAIEHDGERMTIHVEAEPDVIYTTRFIGTRATGDSTGPVGEVLYTTTANPARYERAGNELYVRAVVTSSTPHPNPHAEGDFEQAWVQPMCRSYLGAVPESTRP